MRKLDLAYLPQEGTKCLLLLSGKRLVFATYGDMMFLVVNTAEPINYTEVKEYMTVDELKTFLDI
jgi:hypothetical protein